VKGSPTIEVSADGRTAKVPYANDRAQTLDSEPPLPYREFEDTFK
jgi:hypothetical protein